MTAINPIPAVRTAALNHAPANMRMSISVLAGRLLRDFDANHDGSISIGDGETIRDETSSDRMLGRRSIETLAAVADRLGNGDGMVTTAELLRALRAFDVGDDRTPSGALRAASVGDGVLTGTEVDEYRYQVGVRRV